MTATIANEVEKLAVNVGLMVAHRRVALDLSQEQLAVKAGLKVAQVEELERGSSKVSCVSLLHICNALDWSTKTLMLKAEKYGDAVCSEPPVSFRDDKAFLQSVGKSMEAARTTAGITQPEAARAADMSRPYLSMIESGLENVSMFQLMAIAAAVKIDASQFLP